MRASMMSLACVSLACASEDAVANGETSGGPDDTTTGDAPGPGTRGSGGEDADEGSSSSSSGGSVATGSTGETTGNGPTTSDSSGSGGEVPSSCAAESPYEGPGECDPYAQDCAEGSKCVPFATEGFAYWNSTRCSPVVASPGGYDEPCTVEGNGISGEDSCDVGLMCWLTGDGTEGVCRELCNCGPEEAECFESDALCQLINTDAIPLCLPRCDPLAPDQCHEAEVCAPQAAIDDVGPFACTPPTQPAGAAGQGCYALNSCGEGLVCLPADRVPDCPGLDPGCCTPVCDLDGDADCSAVPGSTCQPYDPDGRVPDDGAAGVGVCVQ